MTNENAIEEISTVLFDLEAKSNEEAIQKLGEELYDKGYVKASFVEETIKREKRFPTGLNVLGGVNVAIPHSDVEHVQEGTIGFAKLREPVLFNDMAESGQKIPVQLVFMLAVKEPEKQVLTLQRLMELFQEDEFLKELLVCQTEGEAKKILKRMVY